MNKAGFHTNQPQTPLRVGYPGSGEDWKNVDSFVCIYEQEQPLGVVFLPKEKEMGSTTSHVVLSDCGKYTTVAVWDDDSRSFRVKPIFEDLAVLAKCAPVLVVKRHLRDAEHNIIGWTVHHKTFVLKEQPSSKALLTAIASNSRVGIQTLYVGSDGVYQKRPPASNVYRLAISVDHLNEIMAGGSPELDDDDARIIQQTRDFCLLGKVNVNVKPR